MTQRECELDMADGDMQYKLNTKRPNLFCLILLISFPSVSAVLISPALPHISDFFAISKGFAQQLITLFIVGYAFGQLIYSPFANRFGRKITIYIGIVIYLIGCIIALAGLYYHNFDVIILSRLLTALGSSVGMIISFTIINDFYHPEQSRPIISYTVLAYAFMPAMAIYVGGFITSHLVWQDCFYFYLFYGFVILYISLLLPETLLERIDNALKIKSLFSSYMCAIRNIRLLSFALIYGLMAAFIYIIASSGPFIGINDIGLTPSHYGTLLLIPYCGQFFGSLFAGKLSSRLSVYSSAMIGYVLAILGSVLMFVAFKWGYVNELTFFFPLLLIMLGIPMVYSCATVMAVATHEDKATGSAMMSFVTMSTSLVFLLILTALHNKSPIIMPSFFIAIMILAVILLLFCKKRFPVHNIAK